MRESMRLLGDRNGRGRVIMNTWMRVVDLVRCVGSIVSSAIYLRVKGIVTVFPIPYPKCLLFFDYCFVALMTNSGSDWFAFWMAAAAFIHATPRVGLDMSSPMDGLAGISLGSSFKSKASIAFH